jgi:hypothetical protein
MTSKEIVKRTIKFENPERLAMALREDYINDFAGVGMSPSPDARQGTQGTFVDEWGAIWENIGICAMGEVKEYPLKNWDDFNCLSIPDINKAERWEHLEEQAQKAGDKFLMAYGISLYERVHFLRGLENTWMDIYTNPDELKKLIDILVNMNLVAIKKYQTVNADGFIFCDDWGLQDKLMISPVKWREIWKPAYTKVYKAAHQAGMLTFLHSCGNIVEILDDLIEAGLDVIQMDQQENMGLDLLSQRFSGRITFWSPVDIQNTMCRGSLEEIRSYCHELVEKLGTDKGGFIAKWYGDPIGAGHTEEAVKAMSDEFVKIGKEFKRLKN